MSLIARDWTQQTNVLRAIFALLVGATVGACLNAGWYLFNLLNGYGFQHFVAFGAATGLRIFLISFVILLIGLVFFGAPVWLVLHATGRRRWQNATMAGALVPFIVSLAIATRFFTGRASGQWSYYGNGGRQWIDGEMTRFGLMIAVQNASKVAILGAIVGVVIWRVAYHDSQRQV